MTVITHEAIRNRFLATSYMNGTLTPEEASAMADFFAEIGGAMVEKLEPVLAAYHQRIETNVRNAALDEVINELNGATGMIFTRNSVIARIRKMKTYLS